MKLRKEGKQYTRQERYLNNKMVKLFIKLNKITTNHKNKYPKFKNKFYKRIVSKL
jgi:hypothetical protein